MPTKKTVTISIQGGTISCTPDGGNVRAQQLTQLKWECDEDFTLTFGLLDGKNTPAWPFQQPPAGKQKPFVGTLKGVAPGAQAPAYKYTITIGGQQLDPIIIVDK